LVLVGLLFLAGCSNGSDSSSGPSASSIVIELEELVPSIASGRFCSVRTITRNLTARELTLTYRWRAFNTAGNVIATTLDFIDGLPPFGRTDSTSPFFGIDIERCSQIASFQRFETTVRNAL